ncbi:uncharacterized protein LOC123296322 [Chrysoperla carnea]|uniref:uncharacterized protein LOC123296322 n=1 Tax=Chrysoperla carnea TaxID=189513 RepID=UPI001D0781C6|nr:uncharacterized protein LOC123296322 [Chrysoperla carnea]
MARILKFNFILLLSATLGIIVDLGEAANQNVGNNRRTGKFFGSGVTEVTKLVVDNLIVTTLVPSSCVAYEPTLRPCRRFRFLNYGPLFTTTVQNNQNQSQTSPNTTAISNRRQSLAESTPPLIASISQAKNNSINSKPSASSSNFYWGDYLNFLRGGVTTKTKTATRIITETYYDPTRVITFSIKHCLPTKMPFNLPKCPITEQSGVVEIKNESPVSLPPETPGEQEINGNGIEPTLTWSLPTIVTTSIPSTSSSVAPSTPVVEQEPQRIDNNSGGTFIKPSEIIY